MEREAILGAWRLASVSRRNAKDETRAASAEDYDGLLIYTANGWMSATVSGRGRARFKSDDYRGGTPEETQKALADYLSYCGRYTFDGDRVTHHLEMSAFPNWVGTDQHRVATLRDGQLVLGAPPILIDGDYWVYELVWRRL